MIRRGHYAFSAAAAFALPPAACRFAELADATLRLRYYAVSLILIFFDAAAITLIDFRHTPFFMILPFSDAAITLFA